MGKTFEEKGKRVRVEWRNMAGKLITRHGFIVGRSYGQYQHWYVKYDRTKTPAFCLKRRCTIIASEETGKIVRDITEERFTKFLSDVMPMGNGNYLVPA